MARWRAPHQGADVSEDDRREPRVGAATGRPKPPTGPLVAMIAMLVAAAGIVGVTLAGSGDSVASVDTTTTTTDDGPIVQGASGGTRIADADIAAIAHGMTEGLAANDFATYSAAFDLGPDAIAQQQLLFDNLEKLPLSRLEMVALEFNGRAFNSSGGTVETTAEVAMVHQFEGADPYAVSEAYELDLVRDGPEDEVRVVAMRGAEAGGSLYPQPWDLGPIHVVDAERAVVIGSIEDRELLEQRAGAISAGAGAAIDELSGIDPRPLPPRVVVVVPGPGKTAGDVFFGESGSSIEEIAGVAADQLTAPYDDIEGNPIDAGNEDTFEGAGRIAIDRQYVGEGGDFLNVVSRHETTHLIQYAWQPGREAQQAAFDAGENTWAVDELPRWMTEGFAEYIGQGYAVGGARSGEYRLALEAARRSSFDGLPKGDPSSFYEGSSEDRNARYGLGMTAFMYVEDTRGRDVAVRWAQALFSAPSLEGVERTYADVLGTTSGELEAAWSAWLRARA